MVNEGSAETAAVSRQLDRNLVKLKQELIKIGIQRNELFEKASQRMSIA